MTKPSTRLKWLIDDLGMNNNSFSKEIGLSNNSTIGRIVNEDREPSFRVLHSILTTYPKIDANWLLTGDGEPYKKLVKKKDKEEPLKDEIILNQRKLIEKLEKELEK